MIVDSYQGFFQLVDGYRILKQVSISFSQLPNPVNRAAQGNLWIPP